MNDVYICQKNTERMLNIFYCRQSSQKLSQKGTFLPSEFITHILYTELVFLTGAQESKPRNEFRQPI